MITAALNGHLEVVKFLVDNGTDINVQGNIGDTALMHTATHNHVKMVEFLINNEVNISMQDKNG